MIVLLSLLRSYNEYYLFCFFFFFFKQKTAYEMRISDWSSDVCSSDLVSRIRVLSSGRPQAGMVWKCPPTWPGPALGHAELKPSHSSALVITPSPAPPSHGSAYWRA